MTPRPDIGTRLRDQAGHESVVTEHTARGFRYTGKPHSMIPRWGMSFTGEGEVFCDVEGFDWRNHYDVVLFHSFFPSDNKDLLLEVFCLTDHPRFICGGNGRMTIETLNQIDTELDEYECFTKGDGNYFCRAQWIEAQLGEEGRIELPAYWDLTVLDFRPIEPT